ncbi:MAG: hypothetical protein V7K72_26320 [Nostoc sp.]|uniref:hypothetical protein n=1 Tax=Nostoc sp. TaxID=1180 RepID=UPI002FFAD1FF
MNHAVISKLLGRCKVHIFKDTLICVQGKIKYCSYARFRLSLDAIAIPLDDLFTGS